MKREYGIKENHETNGKISGPFRFKSTPSKKVTIIGVLIDLRADLLDGKLATTHWEDIDDLMTMFPSVTVKANQRWVDEGHIITSAGISAGIDMSLHLVERLAGRALATRTARQLEFDWTENS
jgi:transcriptional regulator GlxA family with amidase domain